MNDNDVKQVKRANVDEDQQMNDEMKRMTITMMGKTMTVTLRLRE